MQRSRQKVSLGRRANRSHSNFKFKQNTSLDQLGKIYAVNTRSTFNLGSINALPVSSMAVYCYRNEGLTPGALI